MPGFTFLWTIIAICLGVVSIFLGLRANKIATKSDNKMGHIADSQIDEKHAIMAAHPEKIRTPNGASLDTIRRIKSDFCAVTDLRKYASDEKKNDLITTYINPILVELRNIQNRTHVSDEWIEIVDKIEGIKRDYYS